MPSLFSRSRTTSTKNFPKQSEVPDEFGRVGSRGGGGPATPIKSQRQRVQSASNPNNNTNNPKRSYSTEDDGAEQQQLEDGFLPTSISQADPEDAQQTYGYLCYEKHVVLGIGDVTRLVEIVADEIILRGLTTPFPFSNIALDISSTNVRRLIASFLSGTNFADECRYVGPQDLAMVLRWGLARVVRVVSGCEMRGLVNWEVYLVWRGGERAMNYPRADFTRFVQLVPSDARSLVLTLFSLLTRLVAHSTSSGLTPPTLASLFGPLVFGLGHLTLPFHYAYTSYLRSAHALEHLLLAFIRLQDDQASRSTPLPSRLRTWIKGYPAMLVQGEAGLGRPRRGVRTVRLQASRLSVLRRGSQ